MHGLRIRSNLCKRDRQVNGTGLGCSKSILSGVVPVEPLGGAWVQKGEME